MIYRKNSIRGPSPSLDAKNADFSSNLKKIEPLIDAHQQILKKQKLVLPYAEKSQICYKQQISSHPPPTNVPLRYIVFDSTFI